MIDEMFKETWRGAKEEIMANKLRFKRDWDKFCNWGGVSGGKGQPEFPVETVGSFTTLFAVAQWRPLNHPKTIKKQRQFFSELSEVWKKAR